MVEVKGKHIVTKEKIKVLFLCTHNSCRSQMAEGLLNHLGGDRFEAYSAGVEPTSVHPLTKQVMEEIGIDISGQKSKSIDEFFDREFDYVITVCDQARQSCPFFPGKHELLHWDLEDPATTQGSDEERIMVFRKVRDQIRDNIYQLIASK